MPSSRLHDPIIKLVENADSAVLHEKPVF